MRFLRISAANIGPTVPAKANSLIADIDTAFVQQIFHISQQKRKSDVQHHRQADGLGTEFEIAKRAVICHSKMRLRHPARFN